MLALVPDMGDDDDDEIVRPRATSSVSAPSGRARVVVKQRTSTRAWSDKGACRARARDIREDDLRGRRAWTNEFFPSRESSPADVARAKSVCATCPVRPECLAYSLQNWEKVGIWGGETEIERRKSRREMRKAGVGKGDDAAALNWALDHLYPTSPEDA